MYTKTLLTNLPFAETQRMGDLLRRQPFFANRGDFGFVIHIGLKCHLDMHIYMDMDSVYIYI